LFAVAYTDIDPDDGGYNPDVDALIAKLVDGPPYDEIPGPGDAVITHSFPIDFDASEFATELSITVHPVSAVTNIYSGLRAQSEYCTELGGCYGGWFRFEHFPDGYDKYSESLYLTYPPTSGAWFHDYYVDIYSDELAIMESGSPSLPDLSLLGGDMSLTRVSPGDDAFVDVDIYYSPSA
jgi:hypothetical protein